mgnify:CR=1 FL=1
MSNLWVVKTASGWQIFFYNGEFIAYESMMCNCKCRSMVLGIPIKRISNRSSEEEIEEYESATNRVYYDERHEKPEDGNYY